MGTLSSFAGASLYNNGKVNIVVKAGAKPSNGFRWGSKYYTTSQFKKQSAHLRQTGAKHVPGSQLPPVVPASVPVPSGGSTAVGSSPSTPFDSAGTPSTEENAEKGGMKTWMIILIVLTCLALAAFAIWFFMCRKEEETEGEISPVHNQAAIL